MFWENVKNVVKNKGGTIHGIQTQIHKLTGMSKSTIRLQIENNTAPNVIHAKQIADYLGVSIDYLLTGKQSEPAHADKDTQLTVEALQELIPPVRAQVAAITSTLTHVETTAALQVTQAALTHAQTAKIAYPKSRGKEGEMHSEETYVS